MRKLTPDFYVHLAEHLEDSLKGETLDTIHYVALADGTAEWHNSTIEPDLSTGGLTNDIHKKIIVAKKVAPEDVTRMAVGVKFTPNTVYDMFDHRVNMSEKTFFVYVEEGSGTLSIWKCLFNNNGLPAKVPPTYSLTVESERYQTTSDGYYWKFMYRVGKFQVNKFKSGEFIPVLSNSNVKESSVPGSIDVIKVENTGSNYNSYAFGTFRQTQVAGDPLIYSLATSENQNIVQLNLNHTSGTLVIDVNKPILIGTETGAVFGGGLTTDANLAINFLGQDTDGSSYLSVIAPSDLNLPNITRIYQFNSIADITTDSDGNPTGGVINFNNAITGNVSSVRYRYTPALSANTDFYKNSSIYIRSGRGAGQLRTVAEYIVTGNERRIMLDEPYDVVPTVSSRFEILPRIVIQGDGTGSDGTGQATAIPLIDNSSNSIIGIQIIDPGKEYTYASAMALANTGFIDIGTGLPVTSNSAQLIPILPPKGGHGSNVHAELYSSAVCISQEFENNEGERIPTGNDFGEILLMKSVQSANTVLTLNSSSIVFQDEEFIEQTDGKARGKVSFREGNNLRLSHIEGAFTSGSTITTLRSTTNITANILSVDRTNDVLNGLTRFSVEVQSTGFDGLGFRPDDLVRQGSTDEFNWNAEGVVYQANTSYITITADRGIWNISDDISGTIATMINVNNGATAKITGKVDSDIIQGSATILHCETISPITRADDQNETTRLVISLKDLD